MNLAGVFSTSGPDGKVHVGAGWPGNKVTLCGLAVRAADLADTPVMAVNPDCAQCIEAMVKEIRSYSHFWN
jgi:hypothetical protein